MADFYQGVAAAIPLPAGYTAITSASRDGEAFTPVGTMTFTTGGAAWWQATAEDMAGRVIHLVIAGDQLPNADVVITTEADYTAERAAAISQLNNKITAGMPSITVVSPVASDGSTLNLIKGNSYDPSGENGRAIAIVILLAGLPTNIGAARFSMRLPGLPGFPLPTPAIDTDEGHLTLPIPLTLAQTNALYPGENSYEILATWASAQITSIVHQGMVNVTDYEIV